MDKSKQSRPGDSRTVLGLTLILTLDCFRALLFRVLLSLCTNTQVHLAPRSPMSPSFFCYNCNLRPNKALISFLSAFWERGPPALLMWWVTIAFNCNCTASQQREPEGQKAWSLYYLGLQSAAPVQRTKRDTHCVLWGKSSRCVIVTKGWFRVSMGVILLSASMVSIFFNRSMNSRRSAFSTNMSLPSKSVVIFTWKQTETGA